MFVTHVSLCRVCVCSYEWDVCVSVCVPIYMWCVVCMCCMCVCAHAGICVHMYICVVYVMHSSSTGRAFHTTEATLTAPALGRLPRAWARRGLKAQSWLGFLLTAAREAEAEHMSVENVVCAEPARVRMVVRLAFA